MTMISLLWGGAHILGAGYLMHSPLHWVLHLSPDLPHLHGSSQLDPQSLVEVDSSLCFCFPWEGGYLLTLQTLPSLSLVTHTLPSPSILVSIVMPEEMPISSLPLWSQGAPPPHPPNIPSERNACFDPDNLCYIMHIPSWKLLVLV